ncbi:MAG TPA: inositol monophosphatase family protein [Labilithrix sp.]|nr:inositol monophosphatase family protein [Labilithrix sp.]
MTTSARTPASVDPRTSEGLAHVLDVTRAAVRDAAALVVRGFRHAKTIEHKGAVDLVTSFDRNSEALLRDRLGSALPFAIVGEEQGGQTDNVAFYVDPIDGTTNFVHGHPFWCISVGLVLEGQPVLGVVLSPPLGLEWSGWIAASGERRTTRRSAANAILSKAGAPPSIVEEVCAVSMTASLDESLLATGFPYDRRTSAENNFDAFVAIKQRCRAIRRCGSAAMDLCLVADGTYDGYWERKLRPWDIAGGIALVHAAGGKVTDFSGGRTSIESGQVIATNGAIHDVLLDELATVSSSQRDIRG